jgi:hypothetical protein
MALVPDRFRPFVAALFGLVVTGLGHLYLRRWLRAFGWFAVAFGVSLAFVPEAAAADILAGEAVNPLVLLPGALVGFGSAIDAYVLARREVRADANHLPTEAGAVDPAAAGDVPTAAAEPVADRKVDCPACGKAVDPGLGFCHWCTTEFATGGTDDPNNAN